MHPRTYHVVERDPRGEITRDEHRLVVVRAMCTGSGKIGLELEGGSERDRAQFTARLESLPGRWLPGQPTFRELPASWEDRQALRHVSTVLEAEGFTVFGEWG